MSDALELARRFHDAYERLAPSFGYETSQDTKVFDPASANGKLMIAVCAVVARFDARDALIEELVDALDMSRRRLEKIADDAWYGDARDFKRLIPGVFLEYDAALTRAQQAGYGATIDAPKVTT